MATLSITEVDVLKMLELILIVNLLFTWSYMMSWLSALIDWVLSIMLQNILVRVVFLLLLNPLLG